METTTLQIKGMTCGGCVASVKRVLRRVDGVEQSRGIARRRERAVEYEPGRREPARPALRDRRCGL